MGGRPDRGGPPGRAPGEPVRTAAGPRPPRPGGGGIGLPETDRGAGGGGIGLPDEDMGGRGGALGAGPRPRRAARTEAGPATALARRAGRAPAGRGRPAPRGARPGGPVGVAWRCGADRPPPSRRGGAGAPDRWSGWRCVPGPKPRRRAAGRGPPGPGRGQGRRRAARSRRPAPAPARHLGCRGRGGLGLGSPRADGRPSRAWPPSRAPRAARRGRGLPVGPCGERGRPARPRCSTSGSSRRCRGSRRGRAPPCWSVRAPSRAHGRGSSLPSAYFTPFGALLLVGGDVDRAGARCTSLAHP